MHIIMNNFGCSFNNFSSFYQSVRYNGKERKENIMWSRKRHELTMSGISGQIINKFEGQGHFFDSTSNPQIRGIFVKFVAFDYLVGGHFH